MTLPQLTDETISTVEMLDGVTLVRLTAEWCGPCRMFGPVLKQLHEDTGIPVYDMDIDENPETFRALQVMSIPTTLIYVDGELQEGKIIGAHPLARVKQMLEPFEALAK